MIFGHRFFNACVFILQVWDSVGSLSDIFEPDVKSKRKLSFENIVNETSNLSDQSESLLAAKEKKVDSTNKNTQEDIEINKQKNKPDRKKKKRLSDYDSDATSFSDSDLASDDQVLPEDVSVQ